ncbi:MAG: arylsulfatase [Bryobacterales bacterium]
MLRYALACIAISRSPSFWPAVRSSPTTEKPPNFLIVLADDQGWGDLSVNGNTNLTTPNIDSLARDGALLERFFVCPVCSPTRAEFLTGRYYPRGGVYGTSAGAERLNLDEKTIAQTFKAGGYTTAFGKWHNGSQWPYHPNARGFDEYYGFTSGHWATYFDPPLDHNGERVKGKGFIIDDLTDHAMAFIEENRDKPFFAYLPFNTPHSPMQVPDEYWDRFKEKDLALRNRDPEQEDVPHTRAALAMVENIDWNVGRLLAKLDELGLAENTVVIYFSDNGPNGWRWNGDMKGRKGSIDEGGVRSPFLIRWPGHIPAGEKVTQIAGAIDLLPTLADMAGIKVVSEKPLDGKSIKPLLLGESGDWPDRTILSFRVRGGDVSVRNQRFRLDAAGALFELDQDPGQRTDVAAQHADVTAALKSEQERAAKEILAHHGEDDRPYPVGFSEWTWLPARDALPEGGIERSNRFPNSSYFLDWTTPESALTWDVEVGEPGEFDVEVDYACPEKDLGSTVELRFLGNSTSAKVTEANDPPLIGAEHDRTPRAESYTKDFKPMSLGVLKMEKGRGKLTLRATEIPGAQAWEVAAVRLRRR